MTQVIANHDLFCMLQTFATFLNVLNILSLFEKVSLQEADFLLTWFF